MQREPQLTPTSHLFCTDDANTNRNFPRQLLQIQLSDELLCDYTAMNTSCDYRARMAYGEPFQTSAAFHPPNCSYPTVHTGNIMSGSIKRKRSDSELSFSSSTPLSSPLRPAQDSTYMAPILSWHDLAPPMLRGSSAPSQVTSRTLKRHRNSRPPEEEVHGKLAVDMTCGPTTVRSSHRISADTCASRIHIETAVSSATKSTARTTDKIGANCMSEQ